ncbi:NAD(P)-dependent oxidoreductase [Sphaerisporangium perillae]|uniref:NAD(P)-dependent oxidoreductase n=1 Tax=Sphaerisporangium perillae TaxID=2935860 RepID=UPI00200CC0DF|nr:NAD(P)-dependent oxidoreductase [Sphaerisporangium perillae]
MKIVVLDDYQRVARDLGPFDSLPGDEVEVLHEHIAGPDKLAAALRGAEAGLDVYDTEPLPAGNPLRGAPNTVLPPHLGYVTEAGYRSMYKQVVEDVAAWRAGSPMRVLTA